MKKKLLFALLLAVGTGTMHSQALEGVKATDNWSIGISAGGITPLKNSAFFGGMRANMGIELNKQLTPIFGLTAEALWSINTSASKRAFDNSNMSLLGRINMMNLFAKYKGSPRFFEIEAVMGAGWLHGYGITTNNFSTKAGMNLNFNLGKEKAWTLSLRPAVVWCMDADSKQTGHVQFDANYARFQLNAGVVYHLKGNKGRRHFEFAKPCNTDELDQLNATINQLRGDLNNCNQNMAHAKKEIADLNQKLNDCLNKENVQEVIANNTIESIITFHQNQTTISANQVRNVERLANYMKANPDARLVVKGYASPEGTNKVNAEISKKRAAAVKTMLVNKFGIDESRIIGEGEGVGDVFTQPNWNRVSICTLIEE